MSVNWSLNAGQLVTRAYRILGNLEPPWIPSDDQINQGLIALNAMLKGWMADGINMYRQQRVTLTVSAMTAEVPIIPRVMGIEQASWVVQGGTNPYWRPMGEFSRIDYYNLPNPQANSTSGPSLYYFDKQDNSSSIFIWPLATLGGSIVATVGRTVNDVNSATDPVDFPDEWTEAAIYNLADRLMDDQGTAQADPATAQRIALHAAALYRKLCDFDRPSSIWMRPYGRKGSGPFWYGG